MNIRIITLATLLFCFKLLHSQTVQINGELRVVASDRAEADLFGRTLAVYGDFAIIGAFQEDEDENGSNTLNLAGSAYIFMRDASGNWIEHQKLVASDRAFGDYFAQSVAISADYVVIGAIGEDEDPNGLNTLGTAGSVYIFQKDGNNNWTEMQKIVPSDRGTLDRFGHSVAIHGTSIIIGANFKDDPMLSPGNNSGAAYVFELNGNNQWIETGILTPPVRAAGDDFGSSVAIHNDYAVVGAQNEDEDESEINTLTDAGAAYIFERSGGNWTYVQKIVASDRTAGEKFGGSVAIRDDLCLVGANLDGEDANGENFLNGAGGAFAFKRDNSGKWNLNQKITSASRKIAGTFGFKVTLNDKYAVITSPGEGNVGAWDLFSINDQDELVSIDKYFSTYEGGTEFLGVSLALTDHAVLLGAPNEDEDANNANTLNNAGAIHIVEFNSLPAQANAIPDQSIDEGGQYTYQIPENIFEDYDGDALSLSASLSNNNSLPSWLSFNANTPSLTGIPGQSDVGTVTIRIVASDGYNGGASAQFDLKVVDVLAIADEIQLQVYPNPTATSISISSTKNLEVELTDLEGKRLSSDHGSDISFNLHEYQNGTYLLKIMDGEHVRVRRIVKIN